MSEHSQRYPQGGGSTRESSEVWTWVWAELTAWKNHGDDLTPAKRAYLDHLRSSIADHQGLS